MWPIIGVICRSEERDYALRKKYVEMVYHAGGCPVLLTPESKNLALDTLDGILLTGGGDVSPRFAGYSSKYLTGIDEERDEFELQLIRLCLELCTPILGICRGIQVLNLALGGTILTDLQESGYDSHLLADCCMHEVNIRKDSILYDLLEAETLLVNSTHHQAVGNVAGQLRVGAVSKEGVIEAVEHPDKPILGVQWHPERMDMKAPFEWLVRGSQYYHGCKNRPSGVI